MDTSEDFFPTDIEVISSEDLERVRLIFTDEEGGRLAVNLPMEGLMALFREAQRQVAGPKSAGLQ